LKPINNYHDAVTFQTKQISLIMKSIAVGMGVAGVTIAYRLTLSRAETIRNHFYMQVQGKILQTTLLFAILLILGCIVAWMVNRYPFSGGSGIPQVKGQMSGNFSIDWSSTLITKFLGGAIAVLVGMSVGREGPSIQLGACSARGIGYKISSSRTERRILIASGASAGLAAAFNAPLAGVIFALEEIFKYFSPSILLSTMAASITADFLSKTVFGLEPVFGFTILQVIELKHYWLIGLLGVVVGAAGAFYNYILIKSMDVYEKIGKIHYSLKVLTAFSISGIVGLTFPIIQGGGEHIIEILGPQRSLMWFLTLLILKFLFSMVSFGSGVPGGIFFPLLVMGALIGGLFGKICMTSFGMNEVLLFNFVVLAMAGFFTAIVRAPITGIVLLTEMTGSLKHLLSLTVVVIVAYATAELLKSIPVYEALLERQIKHDGRADGVVAAAKHKKIIINTVVQHDSPIDGNNIASLNLPDDCLIVAVRRNNLDITPHGKTRIYAGDVLEVLTATCDEAKVRTCLTELCEYHTYQED
jgi:H+/Cl- antiporter ClcA